MRLLETIILIAIAIAGVSVIKGLTYSPPASQPTPDCQCVDCTCDPCECVAVPDEPKVEPDPVKPSGEAITYFFTREDCVYCKPSRPHINAAHQEGYTIYVVDLSRQDLLDKYDVTQWPTTVVTRDGQEIARHVGLVDGRTLQGIWTPLGIRPTRPRIERPRQTSTMPVSQGRVIYSTGAPRSRWMSQPMRSACGPGGCG